MRPIITRLRLICARSPQLLCRSFFSFCCFFVCLYLSAYLLPYSRYSYVLFRIQTATTIQCLSPFYHKYILNFDRDDERMGFTLPLFLRVALCFWYITAPSPLIQCLPHSRYQAPFSLSLSRFVARDFCFMSFFFSTTDFTMATVIHEKCERWWKSKASKKIKTKKEKNKTKNAKRTVKNGKFSIR